MYSDQIIVFVNIIHFCACKGCSSIPNSFSKAQSYSRLQRNLKISNRNSEARSWWKSLTSMLETGPVLTENIYDTTTSVHAQIVTVADTFGGGGSLTWVILGMLSLLLFSSCFHLFFSPNLLSKKPHFWRRSMPQYGKITRWAFINCSLGERFKFSDCGGLSAYSS